MAEWLWFHVLGILRKDFIHPWCTKSFLNGAVTSRLIKKPKKNMSIHIMNVMLCVCNVIYLTGNLKISDP